MLRLLADENFNWSIVAGIRLRREEVDFVRVQEVSLTGASDLAILEWEAEDNRVVITHDFATMPSHAHTRLRERLPFPGLFMLQARFPVGPAIEQIVVLAASYEHEYWRDRVVYLPIQL